VNSPAADILTKLQTFTGLLTGWTAGVTREPDSPDKCITIYDTGGGDPNPALLIDEPTIQIRVRGAAGAAGYAAAYTLCDAIKNKVLGIAAWTLTGIGRYTGAWMLGDVNSIGYDGNNRPLLTMNFRVIREPATGDNRR
jgi:hypothetical protein